MLSTCRVILFSFTSQILLKYLHSDSGWCNAADDVEINTKSSTDSSALNELTIHATSSITHFKYFDQFICIYQISKVIQADILEV